MLAYADDFNPQHQRRVTWPPLIVVARAHVDQLVRSRAIDTQRAATIRAVLNRADGLRTGQERNARAVLDELDRVAAQLAGDAAMAPAERDAARLRSLAASMTAVTARLRR